MQQMAGDEGLPAKAGPCLPCPPDFQQKRNMGEAMHPLRGMARGEGHGCPVLATLVCPVEGDSVGLGGRAG